MEPLNAVVIAREHSRRLPGKNWRPFDAGGKSLVDLCVGQLLQHVPGDRVFVSCDNPDRERDAERLGVQFLLRPAEITGENDQRPIWQKVPVIAGQLPDRVPVAWCAVTDPLFRDYGRAIERWHRVAADGADSLMAVYRAPEHLLNHAMVPAGGWGWGRHMRQSQQLAPWYRSTFVFSICRWQVAAETGFYVGNVPAWHVSPGPTVDINTWDDWQLAQLLYRHRAELPDPSQPDRFHQSHYV